jgi:hypothetical protein
MKRTNVLFCFFFATLSLSAQSKIIVGQEEAWGIVKQSVLGNKIEGINVDVSSTVLPPASIIKTLGKDETSPDFNSLVILEEMKLVIISLRQLLL